MWQLDYGSPDEEIVMIAHFRLDERVFSSARISIASVSATLDKLKAAHRLVYCLEAIRNAAKVLKQIVARVHGFRV